MSNNNQTPTAEEFRKQILKARGRISENDLLIQMSNKRISQRICELKILELFKQAKAMHKEETCQFAVDWFQNCPIGGDVNSTEDATEYYNETYGR